MFRSLFGTGSNLPAKSNEEKTSSSTKGAYKWIKMANSDSPIMEVDPKVADEVLTPLGPDTNLNLISIFGAARQGKSFLMNLLSGQENIFQISNNQDPCTQGIDISGNFVSLKDFASVDSPADGAAIDTSKGMQVGFVDAEGQGDRDAEYDARLVSPALLASRCVLFNWKDSLQRDRILNLLGVMSRAAMNVEKGRKAAAAQEGGGGEDSDEEEGEGGAVFGHLHIVFRDWNYEGSPEKAYKAIFKEEKGLTPDAAFRNQLRRSLKAAFESITIWLLPPPTTATADLATQLKRDQLSPEFLRQVAALRAALAGQLREETRFHGRALTGPLLARMVPALVGVLNAGGTILPEAAYAAMVNAEVRDLRRKYQEYLGLVAEEKKDALREHPLAAGALRAELEGQFEAAVGDFKRDAERAGGAGAAVEEQAGELRRAAAPLAAAVAAANEGFLAAAFKGEVRRAWGALKERLTGELEPALPMEGAALDARFGELLAAALVALEAAPRGEANDLEEATDHLRTKAELAHARLGRRNEELQRKARERRQAALEKLRGDFTTVFASDVQIARKESSWGPDLLEALYEGHECDAVARLHGLLEGAPAAEVMTATQALKAHCAAAYEAERARLREDGAQAVLNQVAQAKALLADQVAARLTPLLPLEDAELDALFGGIVDQIVEDTKENLAKLSIDQKSKDTCLQTIRADAAAAGAAARDRSAAARARAALEAARRDVARLTGETRRREDELAAAHARGAAEMERLRREADARAAEARALVEARAAKELELEARYRREAEEKDQQLRAALARAGATAAADAAARAAEEERLRAALGELRGKIRGLEAARHAAPSEAKEAAASPPPPPTQEEQEAEAAPPPSQGEEEEAARRRRGEGEEEEEGSGEGHGAGKQKGKKKRLSILDQAREQAAEARHRRVSARVEQLQGMTPPQNRRGSLGGGYRSSMDSVSAPTPDRPQPAPRGDSVEEEEGKEEEEAGGEAVYTAVYMQTTETQTSGSKRGRQSGGAVSSAGTEDIEEGAPSAKKSKKLGKSKSALEEARRKAREHMQSSQEDKKTKNQKKEEEDNKENEPASSRSKRGTSKKKAAVSAEEEEAKPSKKAALAEARRRAREHMAQEAAKKGGGAATASRRR